MKKGIIIIIVVLLLLLASYLIFFRQEEKSNNTSSSIKTARNTLREGEYIQTKNKDKSTRVVKNGTKIKITFGDTVIHGILNDSKTAKALIEKLPMEQSMSRYSHDFCGVTDSLPYREDEVHYGWLNGDIDYAIDAPYFTILFADEENSEQYGYQVNIGVITSPLSKIENLDGTYDVKIELDEE